MAITDLRDAPAMATLAEGDIERGRTFWRDTIGLTEVSFDEAAREATFRAGQRTWFSIYEHQGGSKADHTQVTFAVQDLGAAVQTLRGKGVQFEEYDLPYLKTKNGIAEMGEGSKGAWFKDPGGNIVGIFQTTPQAWDMMQAEMQGTPAMQR